jgi:hypothetical protein
MSTWQRLGRLPAVPVAATYYVAALVLGLLLEGDTPLLAAIALLCLFAVYCVARPTMGLDIFLLAAAPAALAALAGALAGIPRWWVAVPMMLIALVLIAQTERETQASPP